MEAPQAFALRSDKRSADGAPTLAQSHSHLFFELRVYFYLISGDHLVGFIGHTHDRHQLFEHSVGHALLLRRDRVRGDTVVALVGHAHCDINQLFR